MTLGEALAGGQGRNLDIVRLGLAVCVIVSHAWPLALGSSALEPLEAMTGRSLGGWAVGGFFFISGLLIAASAARGCGWSFWRSRARRIFPGLGAALLVTLMLAFASGATATAGESAFWFLRALTLVSIEHRLSGAFAANPIADVVNGPLWSLSHELAAYAVCAAVVALGGARRPGVVLTLAIVSSLAAASHDGLPGRLATFAPLFAAFSWGMVAFAWREHIALRWGGAFGLLVTGALLPWSVAMGAYGAGLVILAMKAPQIALSRDVSYGMYIYGWPVAQCLLAFAPGIGPGVLAVLSVLATYPLAVLSWHLVEQPTLARNRVVS